MNKPIITVNDLNLWYGQTQALKNIHMDEPTSALDPISTSRIEDLAMELKKDYTIVIVTHNINHKCNSAARRCSSE